MSHQYTELTALSDEQYKGYRLGQADAIERILAGMQAHLDPGTRVIAELHEIDTAVPGTVILTSGGMVWKLPTGSGIMLGGRSLPAIVLFVPEAPIEVDDANG
ncbi:hypothetical protein [Rhodococcoides fascians]|uniref:hypothetical protein n=1 Tax=Rhodococcoides fascians TaxID=1828 RepID=UPI00050C12EA|nr:hypothetical protein [Rhodococcus fascians]